jgi:hypothetical protein
VRGGRAQSGYLREVRHDYVSLLQSARSKVHLEHDRQRVDGRLSLNGQDTVLQQGEQRKPSHMPYTRLYTDAKGETHYEDVDITMASIDFAAPMPPLHLSAFHTAIQYGFCRFQVGWGVVFSSST